MKTKLFFTVFVAAFLFSSNLFAQLWENYDGAEDLTYSCEGTWVVNNSQLEAQTDSSSSPEHSYISYDMKQKIGDWELKNENENEWIGWMDLNNDVKAAWGGNRYSCAFILAANNSDINDATTNGYAIGFKNFDDTSNILVLFNFSTGIADGSNSMPSGSTEILSISSAISSSTCSLNFYVKLESDGRWTIKWKAGDKLPEEDAIVPSKYNDGSVTTPAAEETYRGIEYKYTGWVYAHYYSATPKAYFDNLGFSQNNLLPVEFTTFTAKRRNSDILLEWQTATEINNFGFDVERSIKNEYEKVCFEKVGFVPGSGNSNSIKKYSFTDYDVGENQSVEYRIKQIDNDGSFSFSKIVEVKAADRTFQLSQNFPNPFNPTTHIEFSLSRKTHVTLEVSNILGEKVRTLFDSVAEPGIHKIRFEADNLPSGIYFYKLKTVENILCRKMIIMR